MSIRESLFYIRWIIKAKLDHWAVSGENSTSVFRQSVARGWHHQDAKYKDKQNEQRLSR